MITIIICLAIGFLLGYMLGVEHNKEDDNQYPNNI